MTNAAILAPSIVLAALVIVLALLMANARIGAVRSGAVRIRDIALGQKNWPETAAKVSNCFDNQFQLPVLFHILTGFVLVTRLADFVFIVLAWVFVASRIVHALIYCGPNNLRNRFLAFLVGLIALVAMWALFAFKLLLAA